MKTKPTTKLPASPPLSSSDLLGERRTLAYNLRKQGLKYREIGKRMGVCAGRAQRIYSEAECILSREPSWCDGLSVRAANCLWSRDIKSREELLAMYNSGRLRPRKRGGVRNFGWKSYREVAKWLGLPEPQKAPPKIRVPKTCPHCGGKLS